MENDAHLKLQAFVDGELPEAEARVVASQLARDADAAALIAEMKFTRHALAGHEKAVRVPESRDFYWSKIRRQIEASEVGRPVPVAVPWHAKLRRFLAPATAVAVVVIAGLLATQPVGVVGGTETSLSDSGAFTYRDFSSGTTLVWLSYPAEEILDDED